MTISKASLRRVLGMPLVGFAPWVLLAVVEGPGRVPLAAGLSGALAITIAVASAAAGLRPKLLEVTGIAFFAVTLAVVLAFPGTSHWLGVWVAEIANGAIALITIGSVVTRRPFTLAYARENTEREYWGSPVFLHINYAISSAWALAFLVSAIVGYIGDGPLHQPNNIWTSWVVQIVLVIAAIRFTNWYPDKAVARYAPEGDAHPV